MGRAFDLPIMLSTFIQLAYLLSFNKFESAFFKFSELRLTYFGQTMYFNWTTLTLTAFHDNSALSKTLIKLVEQINSDKRKLHINTLSHE